MVRPAKADPSSNTPGDSAATPANQRKTSDRLKPVPSSSGFDTIAQSLTEIQHGTMKVTSQSSYKVAMAARKSVKSGFVASLKCVAPSQLCIMAEPSPPTVMSRALRSFNTASRSHQNLSTTNAFSHSRVVTSITPPSIDMATTMNKQSTYDATIRRDLQFVSLSPMNQGPKRLRIKDIIRLGCQDVCTVFIPSLVNKNDNKLIRDARSETMSVFRQVVLSELPEKWNNTQREEYFSDHLSSREMQRDGRVGHEFHIRIMHYPERQRMESGFLTESEKHYLLDRRTGVGLNCQIIGYSTKRLALVKLTNLPYIEIYVARSPGDIILDDIQFPKSKKDEVIATFLAKELCETKGDTVATLNILSEYFKWTAQQQQSNNNMLMSERNTIRHDNLQEVIGQEVKRENLTLFSQEVDDLYKSAIEQTFDFSCACDCLVPENASKQLYNKFVTQFPSVHTVLSTIVQSRRLQSLDSPSGDIDDLHRKQKRILHIFYAAMRTHSHYLLKYWALIDPLAGFFKGHSKPDSNSFMGSFTSSLETSFKDIEKVYEYKLPSLFAMLESEDMLFGAFDNYQKVLQKKDQTAGKSAVTHTGTTYFIKKEQPIMIAQGSTMKSPSGVRFHVEACTRHCDDYWLIKGMVISTVITDIQKAEQLLITKGFTWPRLGWTIVWMPGFQERPPLEYFKQIVPPPRRAYVLAGARDTDIALSKGHFFCEPLVDGSVSFPSQRMHDIHCMARRVVDFDTYAKYLRHGLEVLNPYHDSNNTVNEIATNRRTKEEFIMAMDSLSTEIYHARMFETDLMRHLNVNYDQVDKMFVFPMSPHCETSHEGMMKVFTEIGQSLRMFNVDESGHASLHPSAKNRRVHLCVDALSAKMFRHLKLNLSKKLTELTSGKYIEPLLEALEQFTCEHDYLHEHRMHRQDVVYKQFYGSVLQAFQVEIRQMRLNGDPVKKNLQSHEKFLKIVYDALKRHRYNQFLQQTPNGDFCKKEGESNIDWVGRLDCTFVEYVQKSEESVDQPTKVCSLLLKMLTSYFRCVHAVKKRNFWICEIENVKWHGAYKMHGKKNYVQEGLYRMKTLYSDSMSDVQLERLRMNRFFFMTPGGNAMSLDEVNEKVNDWCKRCLKSPTFGNNIYHSQFILALMKCGYETYGGPRSRKVSRKVSSQQENITKLVSLFERANIFSTQVQERIFHPNLFWNEVKRCNVVRPSQDIRKEDVCVPMGHQALFEIFCQTEDIRTIESHEEGSIQGDVDDVCSVVSSCVDSVRDTGYATGGEDEVLSDNEGEDSANVLKKLGNISKKPMNSHILKDVLGEDGDDALHDMKKKFEKEIANDRKKFDIIKMANRQFENKMEKRMQMILEKTEKSIHGSYVKRSMLWREQYDEIMSNKRAKC